MSVIDFNELKKNSEKELQDILTDQQSAVTEAFSFIFTMPDDLFRQIYPSMKEEFLKTVQSGEYSKEQIQKGNSQEEIEANLLSLSSIKEILKNQEGISKEKLEFLNLIIDETINILSNIPYRDKVKVQIEFCHPNAKEPTYANPDDAGCDVYAVEDIEILPKETKIIPTGLKIAIPVGWMISVRPRSGLSAKTKLRIPNSPGTIDSGYRDELGIIMTNTGDTSYTIHAGDRIAQLIIEPAPMIVFEQVESVESIGQDRGGGYGHSGT